MNEDVYGLNAYSRETAGAFHRVVELIEVRLLLHDSFNLCTHTAYAQLCISGSIVF